MKCFLMLFVLCVFSGCTHVSISNPNLLSDVKATMPKEKLRVLPVNVDAEMSCSTATGAPTMGGVTTKTTCSNTGRISALTGIFAERGVKIIPSTDTSVPHISIRTEKINGFLEKTTGFFNVLTLWILPMYSYTDYIVSYKSPNDNIDVSKKVRISYTITWFSLLRSNPKNLSEEEIESRAERNLIRAVLDDANIRS